VRLTNWDSDELEPNFSPDGSRIVFRSNRNGGGIYIVPVLGGDPVQVASKGFNLVVPANGGPPRQMASDLTGASYPVWSPDGKQLILSGWKSGVTAELGVARTADWWFPWSAGRKACTPWNWVGASPCCSCPTRLGGAPPRTAAF
jgi:Tol biopolymer transport system component